MKHVVSEQYPGPHSLFSTLSDDGLHPATARRVIADANPGYPCRVSLEDAEVGETLILVLFAHREADSP